VRLEMMLMLLRKRVIIGIFCLVTIFGLLNGIGLWHRHSKLVKFGPSEELFIKDLKTKLAGKSLPKIKITNQDISKDKAFRERKIPPAPLPDIFDKFTKKYTTFDYTDQLRKDLITYISLKAKQLGEDPEEVKSCLEIAYIYVSQHYTQDTRIAILPCYAEKVRNGTEPCWISVWNWEIFNLQSGQYKNGIFEPEDFPLGCFKNFVISVRSKQIIGLWSCE